MACSSHCRAMSTPNLTRCSNGMAPHRRPPSRCARRGSRLLTAHIQTLELSCGELWRRREEPGIAQVRQPRDWRE